MFTVLPVWVSGVSGSRVGRVVGDVMTGGQLTSGGHVSIEGQGTTVGHVMTGGQVTSGGRVSIEGQGTTVGHVMTGGQLTSGGCVSIEGQGATVGHVMTGGQVTSGVRVSGSHGGQVTVGAVGASKETKIGISYKNERSQYIYPKNSSSGLHKCNAAESNQKLVGHFFA